MNDGRQRLILVTGASGAGLSTALDILEDSGINAVDNLPLAMIDTLVALEVETGRRSLAMGLDARTTGFSAETTETLVRNLRKKFGDRFTTVFITASHDDLLRRFNATRRQHPLHDGAMSLADAISADLDRMEKVAPLADLHIDTSGAKPSDLRQALLSKLGMADDFQVNVRLISFSIVAAFLTIATSLSICVLPTIPTGSQSCAALTDVTNRSRPSCRRMRRLPVSYLRSRESWQRCCRG